MSSRSVERRAVVLLGAGGHAKVLVGLLRAAGRRIAAVLDDDPDAQGRLILGLSVAGILDDAADFERTESLVAVGDNALRKDIVRKRITAQWTAAVHPSAWVDPTATVSPGAVVCAGAVVQPEAQIGSHSIVNSGATVDHECVVGPFAHVGPGANLAGGAIVGEGAFVGTGAVVNPACRLGEWSTLGAGAVLVRDLARNTLATGVPATPT